MSLPSTHKALVLSSFKDPLDISVTAVETPSLSAGSAIVRVLSTGIASYLKEVYSGRLPYPMKLPLTPGGGAICRIAAVGSDAVSLQVGQLVVVHIHVRARDDPSASILQGLFGGGPGERLMNEEWRHGSYAEYLKAPLENIFPLDEEVLTKRLGYTISDLTYIPTLMVPFGGLTEEIDLKPGESIVVAPATGSFGGAAVTMALAMGALVIAAGRNEAQLKAMESVLGPSYGGRLRYVKLVGDVEKDAEALQRASPGGKGLDAYIDFSPPQAAKSTHIKSCLMALKTYGRAAFMGGIREDVSIPYALLMLKSLQIRGKFMYQRSSVIRLIGMIECGLVKLGEASGVKVVGTYSLDQYDAALDAAADSTGFGKSVVFTP
ncbi:isopropanol dehydrogenase [Serendipita vermifera]|nr:isopropanol dehydrogenase [Serendipita vermifera]